jgi:hypothetical protein
MFADAVLACISGREDAWGTVRELPTKKHEPFGSKTRRQSPKPFYRRWTHSAQSNYRYPFSCGQDHHTSITKFLATLGFE